MHEGVACRAPAGAVRAFDPRTGAPRACLVCHSGTWSAPTSLLLMLVELS